MLLLFANVESVKFDKLHDDFVWQKTNTFCITQTYNFYISDITDIKIIKAGVKSSITDTIHYMVKIELNDDKVITLRSVKHQIQAMIEARYIKMF